MKLIISLILILVVTAFASCRKNNDVKPGKGTSTSSPPLKLTADDSLHLAAFKVNPQIVVTSVSGVNLIMKLYENVDILLAAKGYSKTSAVHLLEDFKKSSLADFDYTTVAEAGNTTLNWVDDNLNNVKTKSIKDTIINHNNMVKINVQRVFTFFKIYDSTTLATDEQSFLIKRVSDTITFSSYCYFSQKNYISTSVTAGVVYEK